MKNRPLFTKGEKAVFVARGLIGMLLILILYYPLTGWLGSDTGSIVTYFIACIPGFWLPPRAYRRIYEYFDGNVN